MITKKQYIRIHDKRWQDMIKNVSKIRYEMNGNLSLKEKLFKFYNTSKDYFVSTSEANKVPTEEKKQMLQYIPENSKVLDVACGTAENAEIISQRADYWGIEISDIALNIASKKYSKNTKVTLQKGDAEKLPYLDNSFDVVLSTYSLEHFTNPRKVLDEMIRVCKTKGKIILISPSWDNPFWVMPSLSIKLKNVFRRIIFIFSQIVKVFLLSSGIRKWFFDIVQPAVLQIGWQMDNDAVYIVRVEEIKNYLSFKKCKVIYLRRNHNFLIQPIEIPFFKSLKRNALIFLASLLNIFYKYLNVGLFIVAEKE